MKIITPSLIKNLTKFELSELYRTSTQFGQMKAYVRRARNNILSSEVYVIRGYTNNSLVGWTYLDYKSSHVEIGAYVRKKFRRLGLGSQLIKSAYEFHNSHSKSKLELLCLPWDSIGRKFFNSQNIKKKRITYAA